MGPERKPSILICEDEEDLLAVYVTALNKQYSVVTASSGRGCLEKCMEQMLHGKKIEGILLDYGLGDSTGDDIARKIRDLGGAKVILLTAYDLERKKVDELKESKYIIELIVKPMSLKGLVERVRKALD